MDQGKDGLGAWLSSGLANVYIQQSDMTAGQYLQAFNVKEGKLDYGNSALFSDEDHRMIDIVVEYDIEVLSLKDLDLNISNDLFIALNLLISVSDKSYVFFISSI